MKNFKLLTLITLIIACSKEEEVINENNVINAQNYEILKKLTGQIHHKQ